MSVSIWWQGKDPDYMAGDLKIRDYWGWESWCLRTRVEWIQRFVTNREMSGMSMVILIHALCTTKYTCGEIYIVI